MSNVIWNTETVVDFTIGLIDTIVRHNTSSAIQVKKGAWAQNIANDAYKLFFLIERFGLQILKNSRSFR